MPKPVFNGRSTDYLVVDYDPSLLEDVKFGENLDRVLDRFRDETEDGELVFRHILQDPGLIQFQFVGFTPIRVVDIWYNRIEKAMQDINAGQTAA